jgi:hypothetical protein
MTQQSLSAQSSRRGPSLPPLFNAGGASDTNYDHVGTSDLTLLLGGVIIYALLDNTAYSLPPTLYLQL